MKPDNVRVIFLASSMRTTHCLRLSVLFAAFLALGACSDTVSWREEVPLAKGEAIAVERSIDIGRDEWARSGRGPIASQVIRFTHQGERVAWSLERIGYFDHVPVTLDVVDGHPTVVLPLRDWRSCHRFGFPGNGLVAMSYRRGRWETMPPEQLPMALKVNLLQNVRDVRLASGGVIAEPEKSRRDASGTIHQGVALGEIGRLLASAEDSCASMNPLADRDSSKGSEGIEFAEKQALGLVAEALSSSAALEEISGTEFSNANGKWFAPGYLSNSCQGVVSAMRPWYRWHGDEHAGAKSLVGARFIIHAEGSEGAAQIEFPDNQAGLQSVVCDPHAVVAIKRAGKAQLIIYRFARDGRVKGVFRIYLPGMDNFAEEGRWGMLWNPSWNSASGLSFSIVDYRYPQVASLGGTISRRADFRVRLPDAPD